MASPQSVGSYVPSVVPGDDHFWQALPMQVLRTYYLLRATNPRERHISQASQGQRVLRQSMPAELPLPQPHQARTLSAVGPPLPSNAVHSGDKVVTKYLHGVVPLLSPAPASLSTGPLLSAAQSAAKSFIDP